MKERIILHIDINHCFAQIEEMMVPSLRDIPMCVGGDEKTRSGIVLARNLKAKEFGVTTAETLRDAYRKCPRLMVVPAKYDMYIYYTSQVKEIYREYTDLVESYGLDEAWLDITNSWHLFVDKPYDLAFIIQKRVLEEIGLTVSVGLSWNKVFAKLGSDMIKPSGMVIMTKHNYKDVVWKQPVEDLLFVGPKTKPKLNNIGIYTIGDLANYDLQRLVSIFGVKGREMWNYANGHDTEPVAPVGHIEEAKSIGNSTTPPKDIYNLAEAKVLVQRLSESVASRLRDDNKIGNIISVSLRDIYLKSFTRQKKIEVSTDVSTEICDIVMQLIEKHYDFDTPLRSLGINVSGLRDASEKKIQTTIFDETGVKAYREVQIDKTIDMLRDRFGFDKIKRASALLDKDIENFDAKSQNTVYPGNKKDHEY